MSLPLNPDVEARWRAGHLTRVNPDGSPWQGDEYALPGPPAEDSDSDHTQLPDPDGQQTEPPGLDIPGRPKRNASRRDWAAFAVQLGACTEAEAELLTREQLVELTTPPELKPPPAGE